MKQSWFNLSLVFHFLLFETLSIAILGALRGHWLGGAIAPLILILALIFVNYYSTYIYISVLVIVVTCLGLGVLAAHTKVRLLKYGAAHLALFLYMMSSFVFTIGFNY